MRLKVLGYAGALAIMVGVLGYIFASRTDFEVRIAQVRQPLYVVLSDEKVRNRYEIHLVNKTQVDEHYLIKVEGIPSAAINLGPVANPVTIPGGKDLRLPVKVDLDEDAAEEIIGFNFIIVPQSRPEEQEVRRVSFDSRK
jgi:polyferredoxin